MSACIADQAEALRGEVVVSPEVLSRLARAGGGLQFIVRMKLLEQEKEIERSINEWKVLEL